MIEQIKSSVCEFGRENKKLASGRGTYLSGRHAVREEIDRAEHVQTQEHVSPDASHLKLKNKGKYAEFFLITLAS
jgi:hypothetical protein